MKDNLDQKFKRRCIYFIGPGKTGSSSIYSYARNDIRIELLNEDVKDTFLHSFDDLKSTNYANVLWQKPFINKINEKFKSLVKTQSKKNLLLFEMSYICSKKALKHCANTDSLVVISLRNTFDRALSNLMMDYRLGIISINDVASRKNNYIQQCELYLKISNLQSIFNQLINYGQNPKNIMFIDIFNLKIYSNASINEEFELIKSIVKGAKNTKVNEASDFRFGFIYYLYRSRLLRLIYRIPIFKFFKTFINKLFFKKNNLYLKNKFHKFLVKDYKEKLDIIEENNLKFLREFKSYNI